jgi:hypothetical protein
MRAHHRGERTVTPDEQHAELLRVWGEGLPALAEHADDNHADPGCEYAQRTADLLVERLPRPPAEVVEYGVGRGAMSRALRERGYTVHGVDILQRCLDAAAPYCATTTLMDRLDPSLMPKADALVCIAVAQHFPSLAYFKAVAALWQRYETVIYSWRAGGLYEAGVEQYGATWLMALTMPWHVALAPFEQYTIEGRGVVAGLPLVALRRNRRCR